ncbi:hypothetical protein MUG91_G3n290 [Manis pentadactyla]|nr:hypothetical protein MUG91_G3n290 [Manis pentadactyla]
MGRGGEVQTPWEPAAHTLLPERATGPEEAAAHWRGESAQQHLFSKMHDNGTSFDRGIGRRKDLEHLWE